MGGYSVYMPVRSDMASIAASSGHFSKKTRKRPTFPVDVVRDVFYRNPEMLKTLEAGILTDEVAWEGGGYPMYFPDTPELLQMLWRASIEVRMEDLGLETFPRSFAFAWPNCEIEGVQPRGCLIWWGHAGHRDSAISRFAKYYFGKDILGRRGGGDDREMGLHVSYQKEDKEFGVKHAYYRISIPGRLLQEGLSSNVDFEQNFKKYKNPYLRGVLDLTPEENHIQYVTVKLAVRMMVYMRACPEFVREGFPGGKNRRAFESRWSTIGPNIIESPAHLTSGTHASPIAHLRTWHFRSYPIKKNGTRKDGVVFVRSAMVNAEVEPVTVEEGGAVN